MEAAITDAIFHNRVLAFDYEGRSRVVNPHALYREDQLRKLCAPRLADKWREQHPHASLLGKLSLGDDCPIESTG